jgi:hypothetical protein
MGICLVKTRNILLFICRQLMEWNARLQVWIRGQMPFFYVSQSVIKGYYTTHCNQRLIWAAKNTGLKRVGPTIQE